VNNDPLGNWNVLDVFLARQIPLTFAQKATTPGLFSYVTSTRTSGVTNSVNKGFETLVRLPYVLN